MILHLISLLGLAYFAWSLVSMELNYRRASTMGIPLVRLPVDGQNVLWASIEGQLWPLLDRLPINWGTFGTYSRRGWQFKDNGDSHRRYGPIWALVTPIGIYVQVADPGAINEIFQRRADFIRPVEMYSRLFSLFVFSENKIVFHTSISGQLTFVATHCRDFGGLRAMYLNSDLGRMATPPKGPRHAI